MNAEGQQLVEAFKNTMMTMATVETAKYHAQHSEDQALSSIGSLKQTGKPYVTPEDVPEHLKEPIAHASLKAHFQKAQAEQLVHHHKTNMAEINHATTEQYRNKKARIIILNPKNYPLIIRLKDKYSGNNYYTKSSAKKVRGIIVGVDLPNDALTLKPTWLTRLFNRTVREYIVHIVDPSTHEPLVEISIR